MKMIRKHSRTFILISLLLIIYFIISKRESFISHFIRLSQKPKIENSSFAPLNRNNYPFVTNFDRIDWTDYAFMEYEANRTGPGENGAGITLTDPKEIEQNEELKKIEGLCALCSDKIDVNRSVSDTRPDRCKGKMYLKALPKVSIIIIFYNEYKSVLYRTIHSIYNRTPKKLLHEIILVNDNSFRNYLLEPLEIYIKEKFHGIVKMIRLPERSGLIKARMEGAKIATGEIMVFLDAHIEVNVNWLPPLIEPIMLDPLTATTPLIDTLDRANFAYKRKGRTRGIFDYTFNYKWLSGRNYLPEDQNDELPMMLGCAFAINRKLWYDLGAYDEDLIIWGGENYELSFKLWLCGGRLLEVPCSRVAHLLRYHQIYRENITIDYKTKNFKRIAEVWLGKHKKLVYDQNPTKYNSTDAGNLTRPIMIRDKLKCLPYDYYLHYVAPEMEERYPAHPRPDFAYGSIASKADLSLCIDTLLRPINSPTALYTCHKNRSNPDHTQFFRLTLNRDIRLLHSESCLDSYNVGISECHHKGGNQYWRYYPDTFTIKVGTGNCITANIGNKSLSMQTCERDNILQKWMWGFANLTMLNHWCRYGVPHKKGCE